MTTKTRRQLFAFWIVSQLVALNAPLALAADPDEPIAYIGHGGFFDRSGKQIRLTQDFIEKAQAYYRQKLLSSIPPDRAASFSENEKALAQVPTSSSQNRLVLQNKFLGSLVPNSTDPDDGRTIRVVYSNTVSI